MRACERKTEGTTCDRSVYGPVNAAENSVHAVREITIGPFHREEKRATWLTERTRTHGRTGGFFFLLFSCFPDIWNVSRGSFSPRCVAPSDRLTFLPRGDFHTGTGVFLWPGIAQSLRFAAGRDGDSCAAADITDPAAGRRLVKKSVPPSYDPLSLRFGIFVRFSAS